MKLTATINGKPVEIEFDSQIPRLALTKKEAAVALGVCEKTIWRLASLDKIPKTSYGTYPVEGLKAHLAEESKKASR